MNELKTNGRPQAQSKVPEESQTYHASEPCGPRNIQVPRNTKWMRESDESREKLLASKEAENGEVLM